MVGNIPRLIPKQASDETRWSPIDSLELMNGGVDRAAHTDVVSESSNVSGDQPVY